MDPIDSRSKSFGYLISASINGALAFLIILSCGILSCLDLPKDVVAPVIASLLWTVLILAPLALFHYGSYMKLRYQPAVPGKR